MVVKCFETHTKSDNIISILRNKFSQNVNEKLFKYRMNTAPFFYSIGITDIFELIFKEIYILH